MFAVVCCIGLLAACGGEEDTKRTDPILDREYVKMSFGNDAPVVYKNDKATKTEIKADYRPNNNSLLLSVQHPKTPFEFFLEIYTNELKEGVVYEAYECQRPQPETLEELPFICKDDHDGLQPRGTHLFFHRPSLPTLPQEFGSYYAPKFNLEPTQLIIKEITDERPLWGEPQHTFKRIKGEFQGVLAYIIFDEEVKVLKLVERKLVMGEFDIFALVW